MINKYICTFVFIFITLNSFSNPKRSKKKASFFLASKIGVNEFDKKFVGIYGVEIGIEKRRHHFGIEIYYSFPFVVNRNYILFNNNNLDSDLNVGKTKVCINNLSLKYHFGIINKNNFRISPYIVLGQNTTTLNIVEKEKIYSDMDKKNLLLNIKYKETNYYGKLGLHIDIRLRKNIFLFIASSRKFFFDFDIGLEGLKKDQIETIEYYLGIKIVNVFVKQKKLINSF